MVRLAVFLSFFILGIPLFSQSAWEDLNGKILNKKVSVEEHGGNKHQGIAREVSANSLALTSESGDRVNVSREDVKKVKVRSRAKGMLWGLAIGGGLGALVGGLGYRSFENEGGEAGTVAALSVATLAGAGVGIGAASGAMQTVYQAPATQATTLKTTHRKPWRADRGRPTGSKGIPDYLARAER